MGRVSRHLRSNVVGYIALFFALGLGTAWAAGLERNEVKSKHIKNAGVKSKDLANNSVTSPKVANGSLLKEDFASNQLVQGPQGERGERGPEGPPGPASGAAGGDLEGSYPSPSLRAPEATTQVVEPDLNTTNDCTSAATAIPGVYCGARFEGLSESAHWRDAAGGFASGGFYKDRQDRVHLRGLVHARDGHAADPPVVPEVIFYLPAGYRPSQPRLFATLGADSLVDGVAARVDVGTDGAVRVREADPLNFQQYLSLEGISFRAE